MSAIVISTIKFQQLSIGAYFGLQRDTLYPLYQKIADDFAYRIMVSKTYDPILEQMQIYYDDLVYDTSDPYDRRRVLLQGGDNVVVPIYKGVSEGIIDKILAPTKNAIKRGMMNLKYVQDNTYYKDKTTHFWGGYSSNADPLRQRVKVQLTGFTRPTKVLARSMYRARLDLY